jgi:hypothetical protein
MSIGARLELARRAALREETAMRSELPESGSCLQAPARLQQTEQDRSRRHSVHALPPRGNTEAGVLRGFSKLPIPVEKWSIIMKTLGSILAVALIGSFIASAPSTAREPGYRKHQVNTKRVIVNREHPIYLYGNITGAP